MPSSQSRFILEKTPDVLVLGGGLAALMAALAASEQGCNVAVASLGPVGRSGNTAVAENAVAGVTNAPGNTQEAFLEDLHRSGKGIDDPALVANLVAHSQEVMHLLKRYGVNLPYANGDFVNVPPSGGHSVGRLVRADTSEMGHSIKGRAYLIPLAQRAREAGVSFLNGLRAIRLLQDGGRVCGVMFYERKTGRTLFQAAGRVILATGGYAGLYKNTSNVSDMYGDGAAIALQAGCPLRDMEMVQYMPALIMDGIRMTVSNQLQSFGIVLRNRHGEAFMTRYDPTGDRAPRDAMARGIFMEIQSGGDIDGSVYIDCTGFAEGVFEGPLASVAARLASIGRDPAKDMLKGAPASHYTMGGVIIDKNGRTPVPGLYAGGEVAGGVHGANRLGGCALTEAAVFGRLAGLAAASDDAPSPNPDIPDLPVHPDAGEVAAAALDLKALRALLWDHASIVRDRAGLTKALGTIETMKDRWASSPHAPGQAFANSLLVAEAIVTSALMRTESRGAHYRSDYPETDATWAVNIACFMRDGELGLFHM